MTQRTNSGFEERLLSELKHVVATERPGTRNSVAQVARRRPRTWTRRVAVTGTMAVAITVAFAAGLIPGGGTDGGGSGLEAAFAVEQNPDGTVTVEIRSIEDAAGLERQLEDTGIPASVHYLPPGKLCNVRRYQVQEEVEVDVADRLSGPPMPHVEVSQTEAGAFRFTIDPALLEPDESVVIWTMYAVPEHGQAGDAVASIVAMIEHGNQNECELVDGGIEGWGFQEGAPPGSK